MRTVLCKSPSLLTENMPLATRSPIVGKGSVVIETYHEGPNDGEFPEAHVTTLNYSYPLKLLVPQYASENASVWVYPVTFGGGLVGGDRVHMAFTAKPRCCLVVTGQESTKVYHCEGDVTTCQTVLGTVEDHALMCVLSDPVVCYRNAAFVQNQEFRMTGAESSLVYLDWVIGGRVALDELWQMTSYENRTSVFVEDQLVYKDNFLLADTPTVSIATAMKNSQVFGSCIILGNRLHTIAKRLEQVFGKKKGIGEGYDADCTVSVSPLNYTVAKATISGIYIRFMAVSSAKAYRAVVAHIAEELRPLIGGNPYDGKY